MYAALHDLKLWDRLADEERRLIATNVADHLPHLRAEEGAVPMPLRLQGIQLHSLGDQEHHVAHYCLGGGEGAEFLLIPGGTVELGYDRVSPGFPTENDFKEWEQYLDFDFPALPQYLDACMTPLRKVVLSPFLIEAVASDRSFELAHCEAVAKLLAECGFRLLSSDEWEFAYSGGTRCAFPWGNRPTPHEEWLARPNAFGLLPPNDSYCWELCSAPLLMRGGDGGVASCGGWGGLVEGVTRACAYVEHPNDVSFACFRRALTVRGNQRDQ